jgi:hypothetical protein
MMGAKSVPFAVITRKSFDFLKFQRKSKAFFILKRSGQVLSLFTKVSIFPEEQRRLPLANNEHFRVPAKLNVKNAVPPELLENSKYFIYKHFASPAPNSSDYRNGH